MTWLKRGEFGKIAGMEQISHSHGAASNKRIGVVGCGARLRRVLSLLMERDPSVRITAVFDPLASSLEALKTELAPNVVVCGSSKEVCERADVDWVFIGSWNCFHAEQVCEAFAAGKDVFCEKPLALSVEQSRQMLAAQKASGRIFALGLVLRYSPLYREAKKLLAAGSIGKLISFEFNETLAFNHGGYIHGNWRRKCEYAGTHLLEKCCHDLDLALWLTDAVPTRTASFGNCNFFLPENAHHVKRLGPSPKNGRPAYQEWADPERVDPFGTDKDIVDNQVAILEFESDLRCTFHTNCNAGIPERRFYMLGTEGSMIFDAMTGRIELRRIGWNEPTQVYTVTHGSSHAGGDEMMAGELIGVLRGERAPAAGFVEGVRSMALANAIDASMNEGRMVDLRPIWRELEGEFGALFSR